MKVAVPRALAIVLPCLGGCVGEVTAPADTTNVMAPPPRLEVPASYRSWPTFLLGVQRTDAAQVRDIYVNAPGAAATKGQPFPENTVMVMDLFAAQKASDGTVMQNSDGSLVKGDRLKIFLMGKKTGWQAFAPSGMANGDWMYFAYQADGVTQTADSIPGCFTCHLPLGASKDWVQRYDEYFEDSHGN